MPQPGPQLEVDGGVLGVRDGEVETATLVHSYRLWGALSGYKHQTPRKMAAGAARE